MAGDARAGVFARFETQATYLAQRLRTPGVVLLGRRSWTAWFVTGGTLDRDVTEAGSVEVGVRNRLHTPVAPGAIHVWAVLHDERGGSDFAELAMVLP